MTHAPDGGRGRTRRIRIDDCGVAIPGLHISGRFFVILATLVGLLIWGVLYLAFHDWRQRHRQNAAFGAAQVAKAVDPLAGVVPAGIRPTAWRGAVADTHAMLVDLTAAGILDRPRLESLREDLTARVAEARPETAAVVLGRIWVDMELGAGPILVFTRSKQPNNAAATVDPLVLRTPEGVDPEEWRQAVAETHAMLLRLAASDRLDNRLRDDLAKAVDSPGPEKARENLIKLWDKVQETTESRIHRPKLLDHASPGPGNASR